MRTYYGQLDRWNAIDKELRRAQELSDLHNLIEWYFGPEDSDQACRAAAALSWFNPSAENVLGPRRYGLFQLTAAEAGLDDLDGPLLLNPIRSVAAAVSLVRRDGWAHFPPCAIPPLAQHPEDVEN